MPRKARRREKNLPHHIMSRSIPELNLFNVDEDKEYYLSSMIRSARTYRIRILAYCLMDNHVHLLVNPQGGDIAKFMKNINNPYARHYNKIYKRRGHLFGERYKNIVIEDEVQLLRTSTYIHNNAKDLLWKGYKSINDYPYSSIKDYITPNQGRGIADPTMIYANMNGQGASVRNHYRVLLEMQSAGHEEFEKEVEQAFKKGYYETDRKPVVRDVEVKKVLSVLEKLLGVSDTNLTLMKYKRESKVFKSLAAICLRIFSDMTLSDMTNEFKGYTSGSIGILARQGLRMLEKDGGLYREITEALTA